MAAQWTLPEPLEGRGPDLGLASHGIYPTWPDVTVPEEQRPHGLGRGAQYRKKTILGGES